MRLRWLHSPAALSPTKSTSFYLSLPFCVIGKKGVLIQLCTLRLGEPSLNQWTDVGLGMEQNKNKQTGESPFRLCCRISWMSACRCCFWAAEACRVQNALLSWDSEASVWCHKQDGHPGHFLPKYNHFTYGKNTLLKWRLILRFST